MTQITFRVGRREPQNIYFQLGDEPSDDDLSIGYAKDGWAELLVNQAMAQNLSVDHRHRALLEAARQALVGIEYDEDYEDEPWVLQLRETVDDLDDQ